MANEIPHGSGSPAPTSSSSAPDGPIRAIMYTQFEDVEGYVVATSDPPNVMTDQFKDIGYHFLPDRDLCWRLISLNIGGHKIVGVPVHIDDSKYARRAFVFCFCLVVDSTGAEYAKLAAQHLAQTFFSLELQSSYLSSGANTESLSVILKSLRDRMNKEKFDFVNITITEEEKLQFARPSANKWAHTHALTIRPWYVPVSISQPSNIENVPSVDAVDVLTACTGDKSVAELSQELELELTEITEILTLLHRYKLVCLMNQPIDKFSRVRLTETFHTFFDDLTNRNTALMYSMASGLPSGRTSVSSSGNSSPRSLSQTAGIPTEPSINISDQLVRMYCRLDGHVEDLGEFSAANSSFPNISVRLMVIFGLIKGFLRTKVMYPYFAEHAVSMLPVLRSCDGSLSWDEIGFKHGLSRVELDEIFTYHGVLRIWK